MDFSSLSKKRNSFRNAVYNKCSLDCKVRAIYIDTVKQGLSKEF